MQPVGYVLKIKNLTLTAQYQPERVPLTDVMRPTDHLEDVAYLGRLR
jgi:hypothetical protein